MGEHERSVGAGPVQDVAAVVGVGDTQYAATYRAARDSGLLTDAYAIGVEAFRVALQESGLKKDDVDCVIAGPSLAPERLTEMLGLNCRWTDQGDAVNAVFKAVQAIHTGLAECVALIYGNNQRSAKTAYGGPGAMGAERHLSYALYSPWGLTSQGALYALMTSKYMAETGFTERDLAAFVVAQRDFARLNPNAIMQKNLAAGDYLAARFVCEPLRLYDYCLVNDGGVALLLTSVERAKSLNRPYVRVRSIARKDLSIGATELRPRLEEFYHSAHREVASALYEASSLSPADVDLIGIYDSFSIHVPVALEGFGFAELGDAASLAKSGALGPGGSLPVNTSGGHLSESYMQGWNHQLEIVRQLRGEGGARQVDGARTGQYISDVAGSVASIIYQRGDGR